MNSTYSDVSEREPDWIWQRGVSNARQSSGHHSGHHGLGGGPSGVKQAGIKGNRHVAESHKYH